jgi:hypothetical protein
LNAGIQPVRGQHLTASSSNLNVSSHLPDSVQHTGAKPLNQTAENILENRTADNKNSKENQPTLLAARKEKVSSSNKDLFAQICGNIKDPQKSEASKATFFANQHAKDHLVSSEIDLEKDKTAKQSKRISQIVQQCLTDATNKTREA